jgi:glycosyltransferase involved in cell wall biosynthesis
MSANPDQIYDTLKELIRNPVLRNVIGKRGRAYVEKYHSLKAVTRKLIQIYDQL